MEIILTAQKRKSIPLNITEIYFFWHGLKLCPESCPWCRCKKYIKFVKYWIFILNCLLHHLFADFEIYAHMKRGIKWRDVMTSIIWFLLYLNRLWRFRDSLPVDFWNLIQWGRDYKPRGPMFFVYFLHHVSHKKT